MSTFWYRTGRSVAVIVPNLVVFVDSGTPKDLVDRLWDTSSQGFTLADHLDTLTRGRLSSLGSFVMVSSEHESLRVIIRGDFFVDVETSEGVKSLTSPGARTWSEYVVENAVSVTIRCDEGMTEIPDNVRPLTGGVIDVDWLSYEVPVPVANKANVFVDTWLPLNEETAARVPLELAADQDALDVTLRRFPPEQLVTALDQPSVPALDQPLVTALEQSVVTALEPSFAGPLTVDQRTPLHDEHLHDEHDEYQMTDTLETVASIDPGDLPRDGDDDETGPLRLPVAIFQRRSEARGIPAVREARSIPTAPAARESVCEPLDAPLTHELPARVPKVPVARTRRSALRESSTMREVLSSPLDDPPSELDATAIRALQPVPGENPVMREAPIGQETPMTRETPIVPTASSEASATHETPVSRELPVRGERLAKVDVSAPRETPSTLPTRPVTRTMPRREKSSRKSVEVEPFAFDSIEFEDAAGGQRSRSRSSVTRTGREPALGDYAILSRAPSFEAEGGQNR